MSTVAYIHDNAAIRIGVNGLTWSFSAIENMRRILVTIGSSYEDVREHTFAVTDGCFYYDPPRWQPNKIILTRLEE